ncbi:and other transporter-domain-containing protein [Absidia repens]|uniref:And other transporter-domain-containing protein n=1 Tax=Absidia repens TaxID=90262 RepID=A0A1X2I7C6_9FUNG|nr:and other transporter-domain-containing protein [Absidia repens]
MPPFIQKYQLGEANSSASTAAITVSLATAFVASFVSGFVADRLGRKRLFYIGAILNVLGCIIEIAGPNLVSFLIGRIVTGLGVGVFSMLVPLCKLKIMTHRTLGSSFCSDTLLSLFIYKIDQSEIARPGNRGQLITLYQMGATLGTTIAYWISYGTYMKQSDDISWVLPIAFQLVPGGLLLLGLHLIPESPRWLIYRNRYDEALEIMALLRSDGRKDDLNLQMEFTGVRQDVGFDKRYTRKSFLALWSTGTENNLTRTLLGMGIHIFTQLSGINAILFYIPHIVEASGVMDRPTAVLIGNGIVGVVNFLGTLPCFWFIDRWDRRRILVIGALAMALSMIVVAILSSIYDNTMASSSLHRYIGTVFTPMSGDNKAPMYTILVFLCVFIAFFALSWGPVGWIYPAEIYPQIIRGNAMGVTTSASYFFNLVVTLVAPFMFMGMLWGTYLFFGCICLIMAWVVHRYYPETRVRTAKPKKE